MPDKKDRPKGSHPGQDIRSGTYPSQETEKEAASKPPKGQMQVVVIDGHVRVIKKAA